MRDHQHIVAIAALPTHRVGRIGQRAEQNVGGRLAWLGQRFHAGIRIAEIAHALAGAVGRPHPIIIGRACRCRRIVVAGGIGCRRTDDAGRAGIVGFMAINRISRLAGHVRPGHRDLVRLIFRGGHVAGRCQFHIAAIRRAPIAGATAGAVGRHHPVVINLARSHRIREAAGFRAQRRRAGRVGISIAEHMVTRCPRHRIPRHRDQAG